MNSPGPSCNEIRHYKIATLGVAGGAGLYHDLKGEDL